MANQVNTFEGGLDKDTSKSFIKPNKYTHAENLRPLTDEGQSTGALVNIKGNILFSENGVQNTFSDTYNVWKLERVIGGSTNGTCNININGVLYFFTVDISNNLDAVTSAINSYYSTALPTVEVIATTSPNDDFILIHSTGSNITTLNWGGLSGLQVTGATVFIPAQHNPIPIGWCTIRNDIYVLTTNETSTTPSNSVGQWWKIVYDKETHTPTITLVYNNYMNVSTAYPVAPVQIVGRYETTSIQRIYWTDNYNKVRQLNVVSPNTFATDPSNLDLQPIVDMSIPILQSIDTSGSGTLLNGSYQVCYALTNNSSQSYISPLSNIVNIVTPSEQTSPFKNYNGSPANTFTNKRINWKISNIDNDYENINIYILFRDAKNSDPVIYRVKEDAIPTNRTYSFSYDASTKIEELTLTDLLKDQFAFSHCKTITSKNNKLLAANTRDTVTDFEYDARAYSFTQFATVAYVKDTQGNTTNINVDPINNLYPLPETHDAINPDQFNGTEPDEWTYKYKYNSNTLGGSGPNISYEFGTEFVGGDSIVNLGTTFNTADFYHTNPNYGADPIIDGETYKQNSINDGLRFAYKAHLMTTYQRNEIYRFAITFFDKQGRPLYARWIADVKMPDYNDTCPVANRGRIPSTTAVPGDFSLSFYDAAASSNGQAWLSLLYIKFDVNIPNSIKDLISGFRIERVDRGQEDKSILGTGMLHQTEVKFGDLFIPQTFGTNGNLNLDTRGSAGGNYYPQIYTLQSPEFFFNGYPGANAGDKIKVVQRLSQTYGNTVTINSSNSYYMLKYYSPDAISGATRQKAGVLEGSFIGGAGSGNYTAFTSSTYSVTYRNMDFDTGGASPPSTSNSAGGSTVVLSLNTALDWSNSGLGCTSVTKKKPYVMYYRQNLGMYGGMGYAARSNNEYIPCGSFISVKSTTNTTSPLSTTVFGGDTYVDIFDNTKYFKNWGSYYSGIPSSATTLHGTFFFPVECTTNIGLRYGIFANRDLTSAATAVPTSAAVAETFDHNSAHSNVDNLITSIPKPFDFRPTEEHDNRIYISQTKINGENKDSWSNFKTNDYVEAQSEYGPINSLLTFKEEVYFLQDRGFGMVPVDRRELQNSSSLSSNLLVASGLAIDKPQYISNKVGSKHQWSVTTSENTMLIVDVISKKVYTFKGGLQPITDIKGLQSYIANNLIEGKAQDYDNPIYKNPTLSNTRAGVVAINDFRFNEFLITFIDSRYNVRFSQYENTITTVVYNEQTDSFTAFYTIEPLFYISDKTNLFSIDPTSYNMWLHNHGNYCEFYNQPASDCKLSLVSNPNPTFTKMFHNTEWHTECTNSVGGNILDNTWTTIRYYNDYQNTDFKTLTYNTNVKRKERTWQMDVPRNLVSATATNPNIFDPANLVPSRMFKDRMRDKYMNIDLTYNNQFNYKLITHYFKSIYQQSIR